MFVERLETLVNEIRKEHQSIGRVVGFNAGQVCMDIITLTNEVTAWLGRREERRQRRAFTMNDEDSDADADAEKKELKAILKSELVRQARVAVGGYDAGMLAQRNDQFDGTTKGKEKESNVCTISEMVELLKQLEAIPSEPVVHLFPKEWQQSSPDDHGKGGRTKLRWDPRVEYIIPGTSVDKNNFQVCTLAYCHGALSKNSPPPSFFCEPRECLLMKSTTMTLITAGCWVTSGPSRLVSFPVPHPLC